MRKYFIQDEQLRETVKQYKQELFDAGFSFRTVQTYIADVNRYIATGSALTDEAVKEFFDHCDIADRGRLYAYRGSVKKFLKYMRGVPVTKRMTYVREETDKEFIQDCDHDCFNCKYEDCLLPA